MKHRLGFRVFGRLMAGIALMIVPVLVGVLPARGSLQRSSEQSLPTPPPLPDRGLAPEIERPGWLNSERPLRLADLRGRVVLLEFWTFDCINCIRTLPHVQGWHDTYADQGLTVIGMHYPEFSYERDVQNVRAATERLGVTYPVAIDHDGTVWDAYSQRFWPTMYLIDKQGHVRLLSIGEGRYDQTEAAIQALLAEPYEAAQTESASTSQYLTTDIVLNVRTGAGLDQSIVGAIQPGMAFTVFGQNGDWYAIQYGDIQGYVNAGYVTLHDG
jgi:thiol-disulfide isomerase/thioredoxin